MKRTVLVIGLIMASFVLANGQIGREPGPAPTPGDSSLIDSARQKDISGRSDNLRLTEKFPAHTDSNSKLFRVYIRPIYRATKKSELEMLAPSAEDTERYASFLAQPNTGLIVLAADQGCDKDLSVVVLSDHCQKFTMPGAGSTYSFREGDYRLRTLGDLLFTGLLLQSPGKLVHGIFLDVGDLPLEQVSLNTAGVEYLMNLAPSADMDSANSFSEKLTDGIKNGDFLYQNYVLAAKNRTYVLRSIAYRGKSYRTVQGTTYNELEFDKRKDMTVAFRLVRLDGPDRITILWKELADRKAPKLVSEEDK